MSIYASVTDRFAGPHGSAFQTRTYKSRPSAAAAPKGAAEAKGQFRPLPLKPPPGPVWVAVKERKELSIVSGNLCLDKKPIPALPRGWGPEQLVEYYAKSDPNILAYGVYLKNYRLYLEQLELLKKEFWESAEKKKEGPRVETPGPEGQAPAPAGKFKPSEPLDAAELQNEKERKKRRSAARRRQRAAKRERDRQAKIASLKTQVELTKVEKQLHRLEGAKSGPKPHPKAKATQKNPPRAEGSSGVPPEIRGSTFAPGGNNTSASELVATGVELVPDNARTRRTAQRAKLRIALDKASDPQPLPAGSDPGASKSQ